MDDILIIASGRKMAEEFKEAMDKTHEYLKDMDATISASKSHNFASTEATRKWMKAHVWKHLRKTIAVTTLGT